MAAALTPDDVLELAAGTGIATAALVQALPGTRILATDLNPAMVQWAAQRVPGATWRQADAQHLDVAEMSVDLMVCQFGVMFFPDRPGAFAEIARVLRPGGSVLLAVWDVLAASEFAAALNEALGEVLPGDPPTFLARVPYGYADPARIESDLLAGGLTDVAVEPVGLTGTAESADVLARGFCLGTPLRFELAQRGDLADLSARIGARMTARLGSGPVSGQLGALVVTARRP